LVDETTAEALHRTLQISGACQPFSQAGLLDKILPKIAFLSAASDKAVTLNMRQKRQRHHICTANKL